MERSHLPRPGLAEVSAIWLLFGVVAAAILITYSRLPPTSTTSAAKASEQAPGALVFLNYPLALVAIALLAVVAERLRDLPSRQRWPRCCAQSSSGPASSSSRISTRSPSMPSPLSASLSRSSSASLALARGGIGASHPFRSPWDVARVVTALVLVVASLPWLFADLGIYVARVPGLGFFMSDEVLPEPGQPELRAVHLGHHHGLDGVLLALTAVALSRVVPDVRTRVLHPALGFYVSLMFVYGLAIALEDFWHEQLVKRGTTSLRIRA